MTTGDEISGYSVFQVKEIIWFCQLRMERMGAMCHICVGGKCEGQILQDNSKKANTFALLEVIKVLYFEQIYFLSWFSS